VPGPVCLFPGAEAARPPPLPAQQPGAVAVLSSVVIIIFGFYAITLRRPGPIHFVPEPPCAISFEILIRMPGLLCVQGDAFVWAIKMESLAFSGAVSAHLLPFVRFY